MKNKIIKKRIESEIRFLKTIIIHGQATYPNNEKMKYKIDDRIKRLKDTLLRDKNE